MQKLKDYLTLKGWKADLEETLRDIKDVGILIKRTVGLSYYGLPGWGGEMTSRELDDFCWRSKALWFNNEKEFQLYAMQNKYPLGPCLIGWGKNERRYDDTVIFKK